MELYILYIHEHTHVEDHGIYREPQEKREERKKRKKDSIPSSIAQHNAL